MAAAVIHVFEEYFKGFIDWMKETYPGGTKSLFIVVNAVFIILCVLAALINVAIPFFSLSIAGLLFINPLIHIGGTIRYRRYAPGVVSAILLYIPLSLYAYYLYAEAGLVTLIVFILSVVLAIVWQVTPLSYMLIRKRLMKTRES
ncbi:MAG: HXXEE domain-containing protein [Candidatus Lokiarchaeia archaeon]